MWLITYIVLSQLTRYSRCQSVLVMLPYARHAHIVCSKIKKMNVVFLRDTHFHLFSNIIFLCISSLKVCTFLQKSAFFNAYLAVFQIYRKLLRNCDLTTYAIHINIYVHVNIMINLYSHGVEVFLPNFHYHIWCMSCTDAWYCAWIISFKRFS